MIISDEGVFLTSRFDDLEIGPDVVVIAKDLELAGKRFTVAADDATHSALLVSANPVRHDPNLKVKSYPEDALIVRWPQLWHQWEPYESKLPVGLNVNPEKSMEVYVALRRVLRSFHQGAGPYPSIYGEMLDNLVIGGNDIFAATLQGLIALNVVLRNGPHYHLNLDELSKYKISWAALNGPNFNSALSKLHGAACRTEPVSRVILSDQE